MKIAENDENYKNPRKERKYQKWKKLPKIAKKNCPKGLQLEVRAQRAPRLLVLK